jgi:hypothetical protein
MAVDGVPGPVAPATSSGGFRDENPVLLEDENSTVGTVEARNEARIEGGARAENISISQPTTAPAATAGSANVSTDGVVTAQTAGEQSTGPTVDASAGTPGQPTQGSAVDIIV